MWSPKQYRAYNSIRSGFTLSQHGHQTIRFLTLSTSDIMSQSETYGYDLKENINDHFRSFKARIQRVTPWQLYKQTYITKDQLSYYYRHHDIFKPLKFEYFKVETNEGNGVLHIFYRGSYLPYNYLADNWMDIHNSWEINIQKVDLTNPKKSSAYVVNQYVAGQGSSYVRSSQSWDWVFRGYTGLMRGLRRDYPFKYRELWDNYLYNYSVGRFTVTLDDYR